MHGQQVRPLRLRSLCAVAARHVQGQARHNEDCVLCALLDAGMARLVLLQTGSPTSKGKSRQPIVQGRLAGFCCEPAMLCPTAICTVGEPSADTSKPAAERRRQPKMKRLFLDMEAELR